MTRTELLESMRMRINTVQVSASSAGTAVIRIAVTDSFE